MAGLNDEFMEAYKHLDKICREIFNNEKGVTAYINEMEAKSSGQFYVTSWNKTLCKLKEYRHIRNTYVHEVGAGYSDICTIEDIKWLNDFYDSIMQSMDPLSQYRKITTQKVKKSVSMPQKAEKTVMIQPMSSEKSRQKHDFVLCISIFMALTITTALIISIMSIMKLL